MSKYQINISNDPAEILQAQKFRGQIFRGGAIDADHLDEISLHGIIRDSQGEIVCVFRMLPVDRDNLDMSYSAQYYDLKTMGFHGLKALELGRFCIRPDYKDHDIVRLAWAELSKTVFDQDIDLLFGCSSFHGADAELHAEALTLLKERHLAPKGFMPRIKAPKVFQFAKILKARAVNFKSAQLSMPPLLRSYLAMGGWVSDHAVVDEDLNTLHVFTGVEVKSIPPNRRRLFRNLIGRA